MPMPPVTLTDRDTRLYEQELRPWLPQRVLDAHVHLFPREAFPADYAFAPKSCYRRFGCQHTIEQCLGAAAALLPGVDFGVLCFGTPDPQADRDAAAAYCGAVSDNERVFGMTLTSPADRVEDLERRIREHRLVGYKPYRDLVTGKDRDAVGIADMLPHRQMELADRLGLAVMLHIPRANRLADPDNQREMVEICRRYPRASIIFAHVGRAYFMQNVVGNLAAVAECANAYADVAMVNHPGVLEYTFRHFPRERILFGSDAPIAWLRGKSVEINDQYAYLMGEDYRVGTAIYDADHAVEFTFFYYEILRGVKEAAAKAGVTRPELEALFFDNAYDLLTCVAQRVMSRG